MATVFTKGCLYIRIVGSSGVELLYPDLDNVYSGQRSFHCQNLVSITSGGLTSGYFGGHVLSTQEDSKHPLVGEVSFYPATDVHLHNMFLQWSGTMPIEDWLRFIQIGHTNLLSSEKKRLEQAVSKFKTDPRILFSWAGNSYKASVLAYHTRSPILLPNGTLLLVDSWLERNPPLIEGARKVTYNFPGLSLIELAMKQNCVLAQEHLIGAS